MGNQVRIGVNAPKEVTVLRDEVYERDNGKPHPMVQIKSEAAG